MDDKSAIPAAHVRDVDLSSVDPALAAEIRRLGSLMERGDETPEQFAQLIRLLHEVGQSRKAEYLLRRNMDVVADGPAVYRELFGNEKTEEFAVAVEGFKEQFGVCLDFVESRDFLDAVYRTEPVSTRFDELRLLNEPCEVRFDYASPNAVRADVSSMAGEEYLILHWERGVWEVGDPDDS